MIKKEKLEELIKEEATIFHLGEELISVVKLIKNNKPEIKYNRMLYCHLLSPEYRSKMRLENLFENEEDAREYLKYGNVKKTVELFMADWNDVKNTTCGYCGSFDNGTLFYTLNIKDGYVYIDMLDYYYSEHPVKCLFEKEFNRENYNEARDLFVKLFMGEEEWFREKD